MWKKYDDDSQTEEVDNSSSSDNKGDPRNASAQESSGTSNSFQGVCSTLKEKLSRGRCPAKDVESATSKSNSNGINGNV
jgi:hypothetical protein